MKLLNTGVYLLLIQEEAEIKEGQIALHDFGMGYELEVPCDRDNLNSNTRKLVVAYYPLTKEAKELDLPLLPNPFKEVDIDKLASKNYKKHSKKDDRLSLDEQIQRSGGYIVGFKEGYKAAQSKQFSLEDILPFRNILIEGAITNMSCSSAIVEFDRYIQSLSTQQLPKEFVPEYERDYIYKPSGTEQRDGGFYGFNKLKTITNSEGKKEIQGTYN